MPSPRQTTAQTVLPLVGPVTAGLRGGGGGDIAVPTGLVSYWAFNGDLTDSVGSNDGIEEVNGTPTPGALTFDNGSVIIEASASEYMEVTAPHGLHGGDRNFSLIGKATFNTLTSQRAVLHLGTGDLAAETDYLLYYASGVLSFYVGATGSNTWRSVDSTVSLTQGQEFEFYVEHDEDAGAIGIKVNNEALQTLGSVPALVTSGGNLYLGYYYTFAFSDIKFNELRFYERTLTASEITEVHSGA